MAESTHQITTFQLQEFKPHPNADKLKLVEIPDSSYTYCANYEEWKDKVGHVVAWIPPDSLVDTTKAQFVWLAADAKYDENSEIGGFYARIKAKKLRGIVSYGILIDVNDLSFRSDVRIEDALDVRHYEPQINETVKVGNRAFMGGDCETPPVVYSPKYDVEAFLKYWKHCFKEGEPVVVTEKIHGANARYVFTNGKMYCGSRTLWKKQYSDHSKNKENVIQNANITDEEKQFIIKKLEGLENKQNMWWTALANTPELRKFCEENPDHIVYGEVYGQVQDMKYGYPNTVKFAAFDIMVGDKFLDCKQKRDMLAAYGVPMVPLVADHIPFVFDDIIKMAEGKSLIPTADHIREGVVVTTAVERVDPRHGRAALKIINPAYYERK